MYQAVNELNELWEIAMYREIASHSFYVAGQAKTSDTGAKILMRELAGEESRHYQLLLAFKEKGFIPDSWYKARLPDLKISEYLKGGETLEGARLQDTLITAIKREEQSIAFYVRMTGLLRGKAVKELCERLIQGELQHKIRLEMLYDDLFYTEV